jgi:hypothetical protein
MTFSLQSIAATNVPWGMPKVGHFVSSIALLISIHWALATLTQNRDTASRVRLGGVGETNMTKIHLSEFDVVSVIRAHCDFCGEQMEAEGANPQAALREALAEGWTRRSTRQITDGLCCGACARKRGPK